MEGESGMLLEPSDQEGLTEEVMLGMNKKKL